MGWVKLFFSHHNTMVNCTSPGNIAAHIYGSWPTSLMSVEHLVATEQKARWWWTAALLDVGGRGPLRKQSLL